MYTLPTYELQEHVPIEEIKSLAASVARIYQEHEGDSIIQDNFPKRWSSSFLENAVNPLQVYHLEEAALQAIPENVQVSLTIYDLFQLCTILDNKYQLDLSFVLWLCESLADGSAYVKAE